MRPAPVTNTVRTFFLHFATKEDVLLADGSTRIDLAVRAIEERRIGAPMREVLAEAAKSMVANTAAVASLQLGEPPERTRAAMHHAAEIALHYVESLDTPNSTGHTAPRASRGAKA